MAKRRTRKEKQRAVHEMYEYVLPDIETTQVSSQSTHNSSSKAHQKTFELYDYDTRLIVADLKKTLWVSLLMLGVQIGLYYFL